MLAITGLISGLMALPLAVPALAGAVGIFSGIVTAYFGNSWWLAGIATLGIAGFVWIWLTFGLKPALAWAIVAAGVFIDQNAARRAVEKERLARRRQEEKIIAQRKEIDDEIYSEPESAARARLRQWSVPDDEPVRRPFSR